MRFSLLFAEDRHDAAAQIRRTLREGGTVLLDRYVYSNIAYQCAKLPSASEAEDLREWINNTEYGAFDLPRPDLNIFLDVPIGFVEQSLSAQRGGDDRGYLHGRQDIHEAAKAPLEGENLMYTLHFYAGTHGAWLRQRIDDVLAQAKGVVPAGFPESKAVNNQKMVYGMVTNNLTESDAETRERLARGFTNAIPTLSIAIEPESLFDKTRGIYVNASGNGRGWERLAMVEQIDPTDPANEFDPARHPGGCVPAGLRIRGAFSRGSGYPKHSFRLFFRSEYGAGKLQHPMFGDEGVSSFDKIDLRTEQNYAWANGSTWETFVHEVFSRDSERDMGSSYNRSRYFHLFLNGVYWGLYQTEERVDDYYGESYNGGSAANYDVIRTSQPGYNTGVAEGEADAYTDFWNITTKEGYGPDHPDNYNRVRGLAPDGTRDPSLPVYLDVTNLVAYLLSTHFAADSDTPANPSGMANNIIAYRDRVDGDSRSDGFKWNRHDAEHTLGKGNGVGGSALNSTNMFLYGTRALHPNKLGVGNFNPNEIHYELCANADYRTVFADQVYRHLVREGGAMTTTNAILRFRARMAEIDDAIVCEAARWGHVPSQRTRSHWLSSCNDCLNFISTRGAIVLAN